MAATNNTTDQGNTISGMYADCFGGYRDIPLLLIQNPHSYISIAVGIIFLLLRFLTGILNTLTFTVILKNKNLQTVPNFILASLCITDILTGYICEPLVAIIVLLSAVTNLTTAYAFLQAELLTFLFFAIMSYSTQIIIWTERYIGIFYPYFYQRWIVKKSVVKALVVLWVLSIAIYLIACFTASLRGVLDFIIHTFPLSVAWCAYVQVKTYLLVRRIRCETRSLATSLSSKEELKPTLLRHRRPQKLASQYFSL